VRRWLRGWRGRLVMLTGLALLAIAAFVVWPRPDRLASGNVDRVVGKPAPLAPSVAV
jgi:hypothetical protein